MTGRTHAGVGDARRTVLHADMDAFYVSVELRRRPDLVGQPVVVGGTGARGVVAAASYEARRFGVHSAMPSTVARRACPHAVFLAGDHELYSAVSGEVREIFERFTPLVETLSLDEAFLDVTGSATIFGDGASIAHQIRSTVHAELELGCSVGVAVNKFIAKLASVEAKPVARPDRVMPGLGVVVIQPGSEQEYLDRLDVARLWGVGPATLEKLHRLGVRTVRDLRQLDRALLTTSLGRAQAQHLAALAIGHDERPVEPQRAVKSIGHEETFATDLYTVDELRRELVRLADGVASRLRRAELGARTVTLKVRFAGFVTVTRSVTSHDPMDLASELLSATMPLLDGIDPTPGVRLLGVSGSNLGPPTHQLSFDDLGNGIADWTAATSAVDRIRDRFGASSIGPASALDRGRMRVVRPGAQQWGPDQDEQRAPR